MRELLASSRGSSVEHTRVPVGFGARILQGLGAGLLLVVGACQPEIEQTPPTAFVTAVFDPTASRIPLPNDLVFLAGNLNALCPPPANTAPASTPACAQAELLANFNGVFPNDQEVPVTIDFVQTNFDANGGTTDTAPDLDLASFTSTTYFVASISGTTVTEVAMEPIKASDYVKSADRGTLTLHRKDRLPWAGGTYAVLVRGGPQGVKTTNGVPVSASQVFHLVAQGKDMTDPRNNGLLRAQYEDPAQVAALGAQLNQLILLYKLGAFPAADTRFPHEQLAITATFRVNPATNLPIDPARSIVPLPIDLLRDPVGGKLTPLAACTLAGVPLAANGQCTSPAAAGFLALDGFSTTGAILAPTSDLVLASSVTATSLRLYDLTNPTNPVQVDPSTFIIEPCEFTASPTNPPGPGCGAANAVAQVIAIQPAGATAGDPTSVFRTKPLKDKTDYAVVVTNDVKDKVGNPIGRGTVATVLGFNNPVSVGGRSQLQGIDDATAGGLERMRLQLKPVFSKLAADGVPQNKVAMAYTFRTQTILSQAVQLAALPYTTPAPTALPGAVQESTPVVAYAKYGVDGGVVPSSNINEILETTITTFNALDPATGAFLANPANAVPETIKVLIATPKTTPANCAFNAALKCAPLMVFRHGLGSGRAAMLTVADSYAKEGMVTVAIDAAKHGDRSLCTSGTTGAASGCVSGACTTLLPPGAQGDMNPPGTCDAQGFIKRPVMNGVPATDGIPAISGNFLITANFFRTRDSMRQDLIDQSQLIRALAFVPSGAPPTGHSVFDRMVGQGLVIDPAKIFYSGQSLGAIQGVMDVATNPRISKAALNVGGGTIVDIFTNSPAFAAQVNALLTSLGIQRGTQRFLQFLVVGKTVLDPADPINFAGHLTANTLPNLLPPLGGNPDGSVAQAPKKILTQMANCDAVVPNPFSLVGSSNVPTGPLPTGAAFFAPNATGTFQLFIGQNFNPQTFGVCNSPNPATTPGAVSHGFLTDWAIPTLTANAQSDVAKFVMSDTNPLSVQHE